MLFFIYRLITNLIFPVSNIYLKFRILRKKEHTIRYKEKLCITETSRNSGKLVWIHSASVGESLSVLPLIEELENNKNINTILITTITLSSSDVIKKKIKNKRKIVHQFLPLDFPIIVKKFIKHWSPNIAIFIESEIWPNLIEEIKKNKIPLMLMNARISEKSFNRWKYIKGLAKKIFGSFDLCLASNKETENFLIELGAKKIKNIGNLKFSNVNIKDDLAVEDKKFSNFLNKKTIWCVASTHENEELICAKAHQEIKKTIPNIFTVIIPRHVSRVESIKNQILSLNLKVESLSNFSFTSEVDILIVDSFGNNNKFYSLSNIVFLGGSLIKHGGQNPLEPARLGCNVIHGPFINNFYEIYEYLNKLEISQKINNQDEISSYVIKNIKKDKVSNEKTKKINLHGENILKLHVNEINSYLN